MLHEKFYTTALAVFTYEHCGRRVTQTNTFDFQSLIFFSFYPLLK